MQGLSAGADSLRCRMPVRNHRCRSICSNLQAIPTDGLVSTRLSSALSFRVLSSMLESTRKESAEDSLVDTRPSVGIACRLLQIDLQRWFRTGIRHLRESAPAESPCNYGYPERMVHSILCFVGGRGATEHAGGIPIWHDDQMHLAEWQALNNLIISSI